LRIWITTGPVSDEPIVHVKKIADKSTTKIAFPLKKSVFIDGTSLASFLLNKAADEFEARVILRNN
jgi:hypothetical protein